MKFIKDFFRENSYVIVLAVLAFAGALSRLIPHPMNFTPITALALLGGFYFKKAWQGFVVPMGALLLSDFFLGFYSYAWSVYGSFFLITLACKMASKNISLIKKLSLVVPSTVFFFFVTNSAYFFQGESYPLTLEGYLACLAAGVPFLKNALAGDMFYGSVLLGAAEFLRARFKFHACSDNRQITCATL